MNLNETKAMIEHAANLGQRFTAPAHKQCMPGTGKSAIEAKCCKVNCPMCNREMQSASLAHHMLSQCGNPHCPAKQQRLLVEATQPSCTFHCFMPWHRMAVDCSAPDCPRRVTSCDALQQHFAHRHHRDLICIIQEGLLPKCPKHSMQAGNTQAHCQAVPSWQTKETQMGKGAPSHQRFGNHLHRE